VPAVPDLSSLQAEYDQPSARIDPTAVREALLRVPELKGLAATFERTQTLVDRAVAAGDTADDQAGGAIELRGGLNVTVDCPGDSNAPVDDPGTLSLQFAVKRSRIKGSFWGLADHCIFAATVDDLPVRAEMDGDLAMDIGEDVPLGEEWSGSRLLLSLIGPLTLQGVTFEGVSVRLIGGRFEYLRSDTGGSIVLFSTNSGLGVRDSEQTWYCGTDYSGCATQ
jgi:hypothetical protein